MIGRAWLAQRFNIFSPIQGIGSAEQPGHYLDLISAILACILIPVGLASSFVVDDAWQHLHALQSIVPCVHKNDGGEQDVELLCGSFGLDFCSSDGRAPCEAN
jgi:hypothetical protein